MTMTSIISNNFLSPHRGGGILLNSSYSAPSSPRFSAPLYLAPPSPAAQSRSLTSASSSASSSSSTDDISSDGLSAGGARSNTGAQTARRKIRFAPLPDPQRDVLVTEDGDEIPLSDSSARPNSLSLHRTASPLPPGSPQSKLGLSIEHQDTRRNADSTTPLGSDDGSTVNADSASLRAREQQTPSTPTTPTQKKEGGKWGSKNFLKPLFKATPSIKGVSLPTTEEVLTLGTINLFRPSSRESTGSTSSSRAGGDAPLERRMSTASATTLDDRKSGFFKGYALKPVKSEAGTKATSAPPKKAGAGASAAVGSGGRRKGTRMLNGRVYGAQRDRNPFANVVPDEPEFVEWGYGGMGSVKNTTHASSHSDAKTDWSRVQSGGRMNVGHGGVVDEDDDGGSGMGWVKRRREARERAAREELERKQKEGVGGGESAEKVAEGKTEGEEDKKTTETPSIEIRAASPTNDPPAAEHPSGSPTPPVEHKLTEQAPSPSSTPIASPPTKSEEEETEHKEREREAGTIEAVKIPVRQHHHHHHHHHRHDSRGHSHHSSAVGSPTSTNPSTPKIDFDPVAKGLGTEDGSPGVGTGVGIGVGLGIGLERDRDVEKEGVAGERGDGEDADSTSSVSVSDDDEEEEEDAGKDDEDETQDSEVEDEDEDEKEQIRKTSLCAGVEKIARHKD